MDWNSRKAKVVETAAAVVKTGILDKKRAGLAAVLVGICSLLVQVTNFVRSDLKPLLEAARQSRAELKQVREIVDRVDKQFDVRAEVLIEHEERLGTLEQRRDAKQRAELLVKRLDYQANRKK